MKGRKVFGSLVCLFIGVVLVLGACAPGPAPTPNPTEPLATAVVVIQRATAQAQPTATPTPRAKATPAVVPTLVIPTIKLSVPTLEPVSMPPIRLDMATLEPVDVPTLEPIVLPTLEPIALPTSQALVSPIQIEIPPPIATSIFVQDAGRPDGLGELTIVNGRDLDAVAVLTTLDRSPVSSVYVPAGDSSTVTGIRDGTYYLYFTLGEDWDGAARFTKKARFFRFEDTLTFETTSIPGGWQHSTFRVTLHPVPEGTARTVPVDEEQFPDLK